MEKRPMETTLGQLQSKPCCLDRKDIGMSFPLCWQLSEAALDPKDPRDSQDHEQGSTGMSVAMSALIAIVTRQLSSSNDYNLGRQVGSWGQTETFKCLCNFLQGKSLLILGRAVLPRLASQLWWLLWALMLWKFTFKISCLRFNVQWAIHSFPPRGSSTCDCLLRKAIITSRWSSWNASQILI